MPTFCRVEAHTLRGLPVPFCTTELPVLESSTCLSQVRGSSKGRSISHTSCCCCLQVMQLLRSGQALAMVSDAGLPLVNDPGASLVAEAVSAGCKVGPGASPVVQDLIWHAALFVRGA